MVVEANVSFFIHSPYTKLERRLVKERSKTNNVFKGLRWEPLEKLKASCMLMMIYSEDGKFTNTADEHAHDLTDNNLVPKLHISGKLYHIILKCCMFKANTCRIFIREGRKKGKTEQRKRNKKPVNRIHLKFAVGHGSCCH